MRRLVLMVNGVNLFTGSHHQCQTAILKRLKSVKEFLLFFWKWRHWIILVCRINSGIIQIVRLFDALILQKDCLCVEAILYLIEVVRFCSDHRHEVAGETAGVCRDGRCQCGENRYHDLHHGFPRFLNHNTHFLYKTHTDHTDFTDFFFLNTNSTNHTNYSFP